MELSEKLCHLRLVEGQLRGLGRPLTKAEVIRLMRGEVGKAVSHSYLSQLEAGARVHLTATSRDLIARFFKVHPGYLVSDPPGFGALQAELPRPLAPEDLSGRLERLARDFRDEDPLVFRALTRLARQPQARRYLLALDDLLDLPAEQVESLIDQIQSVEVE